MLKPTFIRVIIDRAIHRELDYLVPETLTERISVGSRVRVPFRDKSALATVVAVLEQSEADGIRPIEAIVGEAPVLSEQLLELARWMSAYYCCPIEAVMRSLLPQVIRRAEIGWKKHTAFLLSLPYVSNTFRFNDIPVWGNDTGLGNIGVGFRRQLLEGATALGVSPELALAVEADWQAPLGYNRHLTPGLGDGLQVLGASVHLGSAVGGRGFWQLSGGMDRRFLSLKSKSGSESSERWANEGNATADLAIWLGRSFLVGGRYEGNFTLSHGDLLLDRSQHLVGPVAVYRVDDRLDVKAGSLHTAMGKNVFHVNQYYVAVAFKNTRLNRLQGFLGGTAPGR